MSRKNKTLRAFLHQNQNPTIEQAWDAAWKHAQKKFHARSMQDMEEQLEIERDYSKALEKRIAELEQSARTQSEQGGEWPAMPDKFYEGLGWMHAECCAALDRGEDPRAFEVGDMVNRCIHDLTRDQTAEQHTDDNAVDRFAAAMKAKLAKKRSEGAGGWEEAPASSLSRLLRRSVEKGDPVDVANFAMMLHQRQERIATVRVDRLRRALLDGGLPDSLPMAPYQTVDRGSPHYKAGWNACRRAMLAAASIEEITL